MCVARLEGRPNVLVCYVCDFTGLVVVTCLIEGLLISPNFSKKQNPLLKHRGRLFLAIVRTSLNYQVIHTPIVMSK